MTKNKAGLVFMAIIALGAIISGCDPKPVKTPSEISDYREIAKCSAVLVAAYEISKQVLPTKEMADDYYNIANDVLGDKTTKEVFDYKKNDFEIAIGYERNTNGNEAASQLLLENALKCGRLRQTLPNEFASVANKEYAFKVPEQLVTADEEQKKSSDAMSSTPPKIDGMAYRDARSKLISEGWNPVPVTGRDEVPPYESYFIRQGYTEVTSCGGNAPFCVFYFKGPNEQILKVVTAGEEDENASPPYFAVVDNYGVVIPDADSPSKEYLALEALKKNNIPPVSGLVIATSNIYSAFYNEIHKENPKFSSWGQYCDNEVEQASGHWSGIQDLIKAQQIAKASGVYVAASGADWYRAFVRVYNRKKSQGIDIPTLTDNELKVVEMHSAISGDYGLTLIQNQSLIRDICMASAVTRTDS